MIQVSLHYDKNPVAAILKAMCKGKIAACLQDDAGMPYVLDHREALCVCG